MIPENTESIYAISSGFVRSLPQEDKNFYRHDKIEIANFSEFSDS